MPVPTNKCTLLIEQEEDRHAAEQNQEPRTVRLFFKRGPDCRRYNEPTHNEIAAVFVGEDGAPPAERDIVVYPRDSPPQRMPYISCHVDPMCYPLLFPRGDLGWHNSMQHVAAFRTATRNRLTMQQFYGYRLAVRDDLNPIHSSGKLFQQYVVDAYVKTEGCRLLFLKNNQRQLRVDLYSGKYSKFRYYSHASMYISLHVGLMDHLHNHSESEAHAGVPVILPVVAPEQCSRTTRTPWPL